MSELEGRKLYFDMVKHLTTLSSGSILVVATLVEKLFDKPRHLWIVVIVLIAFLVSVISGLMSMLLTSTEVRRELEPADKATKINTGLVSIVAFIAGYILFFAYFVSNALM